MEESKAISTEQRDAYRLDAELKTHADNVVAEMIAVGRCLKEINERRLYEHLGSATFAEYAEAAVGLKERAAYNYITAYETYGEGGLKKYGQLGITKLVALAQLNDTDRAEMLDSGKAEDMSTRELNDEIKRLKGENDQLRFDMEDTEKSARNNAEQVAKLQKELDEARGAIKELAKTATEVRELKQKLADAEHPVVAAMSDEEKEDIRREAEKHARKQYENKVSEMRKTNEDAIEHAHELEKKVGELTEQLEAAVTANAELQANTKKAAPPSGNKELLKYHLEALAKAYTGAMEVLDRFDGEDRDKFRAAIIKIAEDIRTAAESR